MPITSVSCVMAVRLCRFDPSPRTSILWCYRSAPYLSTSSYHSLLRPEKYLPIHQSTRDTYPLASRLVLLPPDWKGNYFIVFYHAYHMNEKKKHVLFWWNQNIQIGLGTKYKPVTVLVLPPSKLIPPHLCTSPSPPHPKKEGYDDRIRVTSPFSFLPITLGMG